jgi:hypothetical protein
VGRVRGLVALGLCALLLAACGGDDETAAPAAMVADLTVTLDPDGDGPEAPREATVRCERGDATPACEAATTADFEPPPDDVACTQQFGGPEVATVKGTLQGERVDATFSREDGCQIARWETAKPLIEAAG